MGTTGDQFDGSGYLLNLRHEVRVIQDGFVQSDVLSVELSARHQVIFGPLSMTLPYDVESSRNGCLPPFVSTEKVEISP